MSDQTEKRDSVLDVDLTIGVGQADQGIVVEVRFVLERGVAVLFGPSGAGKTLTLRAIAGFVKPMRGVLRGKGAAFFDAERQIEVRAEARKVGYVPQDQGLFPHLDVLGNVVFGLSRAERRKPGPEVNALIEELGLSRLVHSRVSSLSGGERQRVALARALAGRPELLLLDEPLSALDRTSRQEIRRYLREVLERRGLSAVMVTHDAEEAAALGNVFVRFERSGGMTRAEAEPAAPV